MELNFKPPETKTGDELGVVEPFPS